MGYTATKGRDALPQKMESTATKGWDALRDQVYVRVGGCPTCFVANNPHYKPYQQTTSHQSLDTPIHSTYFGFHPLAIWILYLRFTTFSLKGGG